MPLTSSPAASAAAGSSAPLRSPVVVGAKSSAPSDPWMTVVIIGLRSNRGNGFGPSDLIGRELSVWDRGAVDLKSNGRHSVPIRDKGGSNQKRSSQI